MKFILTEDCDESKIFEKFPLFEQIGRADFGIKLWILLKGIQAGDGKPVLITALGHKPCTAMLLEDKKPEDIMNVLDTLVEQGLVIIPDAHTIESSKQFVVTFSTAHELNKIIMTLNFTKYLDESSDCRRFLEQLGFDHTSNFRRSVANQAKNGIYWMNDQNGLGTAKLVVSVLLNQLMKLFPLEFPE